MSASELPGNPELERLKSLVHEQKIVPEDLDEMVHDPSPKRPAASITKGLIVSWDSWWSPWVPVLQKACYWM